MNENLPYWSPSRSKYWVSYWLLRLDFPNMSLPMYMDLPEIDVFQMHTPEVPEPPEGQELNWLLEAELNTEDGKYYQKYKFVPIVEE